MNHFEQHHKSMLYIMSDWHISLPNTCFEARAICPGQSVHSTSFTSTTGCEPNFFLNIPTASRVHDHYQVECLKIDTLGEGIVKHALPGSMLREISKNNEKD